MMTEYRLEVLQEYSEKRGHILSGTLHAYWHEGGIEALRAKRREAVQRQQSLKVNYM